VQAAQKQGPAISRPDGGEGPSDRNHSAFDGCRMLGKSPNEIERDKIHRHQMDDVGPTLLFLVVVISIEESNSKMK
jgi:hypothetical protein